ncbi:MAG: M48 family metalloprotease, partial [Planctomycetota bacterium]
EYCFAARLGWAERGFTSALKSVWRDARASIAWLVIPVLLLIAAFDALSVASTLGVTLSPLESILLTAGFSIGLIVFGLPRLLQHFFPTEAVEPSQEAWLSSVAESAGVRGCRFRRWKTQGLVFNAMIAGVAPKSRVMLISDRLLDEASPEHLTMIILHELAHARRRHVLVRILSMIPAWACGAAVQTLIIRTMPETPIAEYAGCVGNLIAISLTFVTLRLVSHWIEFDADRVACELSPCIAFELSRGREASAVSSERFQVPPSTVEARQQLSDALIEVTRDDPSATQRSWLHPSVSERVVRLKRDDPWVADCRESSFAQFAPGAQETYPGAEA